MRLISLCPSNTELLAYLDLIPALVGVDDHSSWPKEIHSLKKVGPDLAINIETVKTLKPDLVLASLSVPGMEKNIEQLQKENIPHLILNPQSLSDIANDLYTVGTYTNKEKEALQIIEQYDSFIQYYKELSKTIKTKRSVYFEWWPKPVFTPGGSNWLTEMCELAGANNIFATENLPSVQTNFEEVMKRNPEVMFMAWVGVAEEKMNIQHFLKREGSDNITAVQENELYTLEESLYCRPSPRLLLGLKKLAALLHPSVFPKDDGIDPLR